MSKAPSMPMFWDAYLADTTHLTTEEHGAYLLLLAAMWRRNGSVPDDDKDNARILGLTKAKWVKIKRRLSTFLTIENEQISQKNLQKIWKKTQESIQKNRENGAKGGRPVSNKNNNLAKANGSVSQNPIKTIPEPEPYIQKEIDKSISKKEEKIPPEKPKEKSHAKRGKRIETEFGEDWQIPEKYIAYARGKQFPKSEIETEFEKFCNHWRAKSGKDATKCDWFATWRNWILNASKWRGGNGSYSSNSNGRGETSILDLTAEIIAERGGGDARDYD